MKEKILMQVSLKGNKISTQVDLQSPEEYSALTQALANQLEKNMAIRSMLALWLLKENKIWVLSDMANALETYANGNTEDKEERK